MAHSGTIIHMRNVPEKGDAWRALDQSLPCKMWPGWKGGENVPAHYEWDGHSSGVLAPLFPKWNHPIASCRHDWRCACAENADQRAWADREFEADVGTTAWWVTKKLGYLGVRAGAFLGIGNNF